MTWTNSTKWKPIVRCNWRLYLPGLRNKAGKVQSTCAEESLPDLKLLPELRKSKRQDEKKGDKIINYGKPEIAVLGTAIHVIELIGPSSKPS